MRFVAAAILIGALSVADAAAAQPSGAAVFGQCAGCHALKPGPSGVGPNLLGVVGRQAGTLAGYDYTLGTKTAGKGGLVWTEDALDHFLADPYSVPDNGMEFSGLPNAADRKAVIDYIKSAPH